MITTTAKLTQQSFERYRQRAEEHKPQTPAGLRASAMSMLQNGLTPCDVAHVLRINVNALHYLIGCED
jgi:hypothetical protein